MTDISETKIVVDGAYEMLTFNLHDTSNEEFASQIQNYKLPWVNMHAPGWIGFTIKTKHAKENIAGVTAFINELSNLIEPKTAQNHSAIYEYSLFYS